MWGGDEEIARRRGMGRGEEQGNSWSAFSRVRREVGRTRISTLAWQRHRCHVTIEDTR